MVTQHRQDIMFTFVKKFYSEEGGATAIEYGLIVGLVFLAIVAAVQGYSTQMGAMYNTTASTIDNAISG